MSEEEDTPPLPEIEAPRIRALRLVEAILFAAKEPVSETALQLRLPHHLAASGLVAELAQHYRLRGVNLVLVAGGWTLRTAPDLAGDLAIERIETRKLSRAQIETLAIIAYHQPVTRAEVEEIRGVTLHKGTLDLLLETGWIAPKGHRDSPGRPMLWVTTAAFLEHFGLASLADLPRVDELRAAGLLDARPVALRGEAESVPREVAVEEE